MMRTRVTRRVTLLVIFALVLAATAQVVPTVTAQEEAVTIDLAAIDDSNISGTAVLTPMGDQTEVTVTLEATGDAALDTPRPTHIHSGQCGETLGGVEYGLNDVTDEATTTVDASLESLMDGNHAINVHLSADEISTYVACGNIPAAQQDEAPETMPEAGATVSDSIRTVSYMLVAVGVVLFLVGGFVFLAQRRRHA